MSHWTVNDQARVNAQMRSSFKRQKRMASARLREHTPPPIQRAPVGCCQFRIRAAGVQAECGQPATHEGIGRNALLYCPQHAAWLQPLVRPLNP